MPTSRQNASQDNSIEATDPKRKVTACHLDHVAAGAW